MTTKAILRSEARLRLASLSIEEIARMGVAVEASVWTLPEVRAAKVLLLYASVGTEVPTDSIAIEARRRGIQVLYPRCSPQDPTMTLHAVASADQLLDGGRFGIREPAADCAAVDVGSVDVAFVPGLAWDRAGHRLGRGAGYYDRLMDDPTWRAFRCGLFFSAQEVPTVPVDSWDQRLDVIVTEREIVRVGGRE